MAELSEKYVKTSESHLIGHGKFRKKGEVLKLWKVRNYKMFNDGILITFDPSKNTTTNIYNLSKTTFADLDKKYVDKSGAPRGEGMALSVHCVKFGQLDLVLDSKQEAEAFVTSVGQVNLFNATEAQQFAVSHYWHDTATRLEEEIERLEDEQGGEGGGDSDDEDSLDEEGDLQRLSMSGFGSTGHSINVLQRASDDTFTDTRNSIVCAGKFLKQNTFKKNCYLDDWKERRFSLSENGDLVYVNRLGFDNTLEVSGCMITFVEVGVLDSGSIASSAGTSGEGDKPDVVLAIELLVAKSSNKTKCISFDAENTENNLKQLDDFVNVLQKKFKAVVMNQSVRGKKIKKEKKVIVAVLEDFSSAIAPLLAAVIFCASLFIMDGYI